MRGTWERVRGINLGEGAGERVRGTWEMVRGWVREVKRKPRLGLGMSFAHGVTRTIWAPK